MDNMVFLKSIPDFNGWEFIINDYQRGYRWNKQQVIDLLNDLNIFRIKENNKKIADNEIYCLQPIIIKKMGENKYELIDGQQRLTTLYILLEYIRMFAIEGREKIKYKIIYEAKDKAIENENQRSSYFLSNINDISLSNCKNLDYYFMKNAYNTIKNWFGNDIDLAKNFNNLLTDKENNKIKFICFEIAEDRNDSEKIFSRINNNQIKLTDSELIKAQILFDVGSSDETKLLKQINISNEWNKMESTLYNDKFWYFLSTDKNKDNRTRIIFDFLAKKYNSTNTARKYDTFEKVMEHLKEVDAYEFWNDEVQKVLNIFKMWYESPEMYNYIGYLNNVNFKEKKHKIGTENFLYLYDNNKNIKTKSDFILELKKEIKEKLQKIKLDELTYLNNNKDQIKAILLLFNVLTTQTETEYKKFPYDQYNKYSWEIEHLHPQNEQKPNDENYEDWKKGILQYIKLLTQQKILNENKQRELENILKEEKNDKDSKKRVYNEATEKLSVIMQIDMHKIGNLALLDKERNIKFSNKFFDEKREELIKNSKDNSEDTINKNIFTPICTRNAFLKVYSEKPDSLSIWTKDDMENYREKMVEKLQDFVKIGDEVNE